MTTFWDWYDRQYPKGVAQGKKHPSSDNPRICIVCNATYLPKQYNQVACGDFYCRSILRRKRARGYKQGIRIRHVPLIVEGKD